ncbi:MAG: hypothetical protein M1814_006446 [Vezdaea aestivalis]|nr:MAG: hypothetical protein M1814_006446 [Vezdaea aestivalis]
MWSPACRLAALFSLFSLLGQSDAYEYSLSNGGKADDRVVCAGSLPVEFFLISATDDLTRFCVETIGTLCYRSLSPNPPLIFTVPSQRIFGNVFLNGARAKQICSVKCHCSGYSSTDIAVIPDLATLGQPLTPSTDWAIPWHFDLPTHISPRMRIRLGQKNNILYELVEGDAQPISVTGDLVNRPDCAGEELSSALISGLSAAFIGGRVPYLNYTQLCAHHYYGGHNRTNAGGICVHDRHDPESEREFALPYETKSPLFSGDLDDAASPALLALPASVDRECRQACSCSHLVPKQKQEDFGRNYASEVDLHVPHPYEDDGRFRPTAEEELEDQLQLEGTCSGSCYVQTKAQEEPARSGVEIKSHGEEGSDIECGNCMPL